MRSGALMIQGTCSDAGKSVVVAGLCRIARRRGIPVAPFKPQNMSNNAAACPGGGEIGRAQALQARAAGLVPSVDMNPVLLKPQSDRTSQVVVHGRATANLEAADYMARRERLLDPVMESFERLAGACDLVIVEGAGSAAETNLRAGDIANMGFARRAEVPVCLLADIERGGVIAAVAGTKAVLDPADAAMIRSFAVNKLRGDPALFDQGVRDIVRHTGWPCRGVIPWLDAARRLPREDAATLDRTGAATPGGSRHDTDPRPQTIGSASWRPCSPGSPTSTTPIRCAWSRRWTSTSCPSGTAACHGMPMSCSSWAPSPPSAISLSSDRRGLGPRRDRACPRRGPGARALRRIPDARPTRARPARCRRPGRRSARTRPARRGDGDGRARSRCVRCAAPVPAAG